MKPFGGMSLWWLVVAVAVAGVDAVPLRLMTFNIWNSGRNVVNGTAKIASHIAQARPHILALQVRR